MPSVVEPVAMIEAEGFVVPHEIEAESGFRARRLLLGAAWRVTPGVRAVASIDAASDEHHPLVWDAFVELTHGPLEVTGGFAQVPLFASIEQPREAMPVSDLSLAVEAFWPGRDAGVTVHLRDARWPVEGWARVGNGSGGARGNDNDRPSGEARLDATFGRARFGADRSDVLGLRIGVGGHLEDAFDRPGLTVRLPSGFEPWRSPTIDGQTAMAEAHAVGLLGPVQVLAEGALATEGRSRDTDGNPDTPRRPLPSASSVGGSAEAAWMVTGQRRLPGDWPIDGDALGVEVASRASRVSVGRGARDLDPGGVSGLEGCVRLWHPLGVGGGVTGGAFRYDTPPLEELDVTSSWFVALRLAARWR